MTHPATPFTPAADDSPGDRFQKLVDIMRTLRSADGCAWDREQTLATLRPFILEEAYEVVAAIDRERPDEIRDELGDLLLETVFVAQIAAERDDFTIADATDAIITKLIRRHPHVFTGATGDTVQRNLSPAEVKAQWERIKADERGTGAEPGSLLDGIPDALPSLLRASRIGARTANVGFDWDTAQQVLHKADEELAELREAIDDGDRRQIEEELGDLLFTIANLARKLRVEPESALRAANTKFTRRFRTMEQRLAAGGRSLQDASSAELEQAWQAVKRDG